MFLHIDHQLLYQRYLDDFEVQKKKKKLDENKNSLIV